MLNRCAAAVYVYTHAVCRWLYHLIAIGAAGIGFKIFYNPDKFGYVPIIIVEWQVYCLSCFFFTWWTYGLSMAQTVFICPLLSEQVKIR